jgi:short-subunit dehydrogenase
MIGFLLSGYKYLYYDKLMIYMKYALITGASKGIGREMAISLAKRKYNLLLVARSEDELSALEKELKNKYSVKVFYKVIDLSLPLADKLVYEWCTENDFEISILINNAGYGLWGYFDQLSLQDQQNMMRLNTGLPVDLCYHFVPLLKKNAPAHILNIASTASYQAVPALSVYAATKSFLRFFSRGLRTELKKSGINVSCLCPGPVKTGFAERAGMNSIMGKMDQFGMQADEVAEKAIRSMLKGKAEIIPGFLNRVGVFIVWLLPESLVELVVARAFRK